MGYLSSCGIDELADFTNDAIEVDTFVANAADGDDDNSSRELSSSDDSLIPREV